MITGTQSHRLGILTVPIIVCHNLLKQTGSQFPDIGSIQDSTHWQVDTKGGFHPIHQLNCHERVQTNTGQRCITINLSNIGSENPGNLLGNKVLQKPNTLFRGCRDNLRADRSSGIPFPLTPRDIPVKR